mgnify:CR=1 FL=1
MSLSIICSIIQNVFISWAVDPNKASKVGIKRRLFGNYNNNSDDDDDPKKSKQYSMAMFSISYNEAAQALMALFTLHLIRRIKNRTVYGLSLQPHFIPQPNIENENIQPMEQIEQIEPIQMGFNPNNVIIEHNNIMNNNNMINGSVNPNSLSSNF